LVFPSSPKAILKEFGENAPVSLIVGRLMAGQRGKRGMAHSQGQVCGEGNEIRRRFHGSNQKSYNTGPNWLGQKGVVCIASDNSKQRGRG